MTKASLVIPTRGGAHRLPVLLEALSAQDHPDWEAIVVIDGDIDGSAGVVARRTDVPVRTIVLPRNMGRVGALNAGYEAAAGEVIIRCDDDFEPSPRHISAHVAAHSEQECGAIALPLNIAPDNAYMRAYGHDADERSRRDAYAAAPQDRWRFWGGNTSVSRAVYESVGPFDDSYKGYGWEDVDYGYRVHRAGYPIVMVRGAEVRHHMASVDTRTRAMRAFWSGQARNHFDSLHGTGTSGAGHRPRSAWELATRTLASTLTAHRSEELAAAIDTALPHLPRALGRKAVALVVESAAHAGAHQGRV